MQSTCKSNVLPVTLPTVTARHRLPLIVIAALLFARPAAGKDMSQVLKGLIPDISLVLDVAGAYFSEDPLQLGAHDPRRTGVTLQQLELNVTSSVDHIFKMEANIVFAEFGVEIEEAYATSLGIPWGFQVRAGLFLTRFGRMNPTHPHSWSFVDQPLVNGKLFGGEGSRALGGELSWLAPLPWFLELSASLSEAAGDCCARSFYGAEDLGVDGASDLLYTVNLKQFFPIGDDWSIYWGLSGQFGPNPTGKDNRTEIYGSDLYVRYRPVDSPNRFALSLTVEGMFRSRQVPGDVLQDWGMYTMLVSTLTREWELGARYGYVSGVSDDPLDPGQDEPRHRASLQVTYYPSHFSRLRLQGSYDRPEWDGGKDIWAAILALEFTIGAHGDHAF